MSTKNYWLMKSEPEPRIVNGKSVKFSIDDLKDVKVEHWDGVRNHEAKNNMKAMKVGDGVFFYHSNCKTPGIVGLAKVVKEAYPDSTAFDKSAPYYDAKSDPENPRWFMVDVGYDRHLKRLIGLEELKGYKELENMALRRRMRLSVTAVTKEEWDFILSKESELSESANESSSEKVGKKDSAGSKTRPKETKVSPISAKSRKQKKSQASAESTAVEEPVRKRPKRGAK